MPSRRSVADSVEQFRYRHPEAVGKLYEHADARIAAGTLDPSDVGQVESRALGELLLRQPPFSA
jgi:hypothetical protein